MFGIRLFLSTTLAAALLGASFVKAASLNRISTTERRGAVTTPWTEFVIHSFDSESGGNDGQIPFGNLLRDRSGALYGTTQSGGKAGGGTVFRLIPPASGKAAWTEQILVAFALNGNDGSSPASGLIADGDGALYGTTTVSGPGCTDTCGTVFRLTPPAAGKHDWTRTVLHNFDAARGDGAFPEATLVMDSRGALYGTTELGGAYNGGCTGRCGTVFRLTPPERGKSTWTESVLHSFDARDGAYPTSSLLVDARGALYGTTYGGGQYGAGTVFKLTPPCARESVWKETILHAFMGGSRDGSGPTAGLLADKRGALYGTTALGGPSCFSECGTVFKLTPTSAMSWKLSLLHVFGPITDSGGYHPASALIADTAGALYGTTEYGGAGGYGTVFELSPPEAGKSTWSPRTLHAFSGLNGDGGFLTASLVGDPSGALYGTSSYGGLTGAGMVFRLVK